MVYVISKAGKPLMPTERHGKLRLIERAKTVMLERREERVPLHLKEDGVSCAQI